MIFRTVVLIMSLSFLPACATKGLKNFDPNKPVLIKDRGHRLGMFQNGESFKFEQFEESMKASDKASEEIKKGWRYVYAGYFGLLAGIGLAATGETATDIILAGGVAGLGYYSLSHGMDHMRDAGRIHNDELKLDKVVFYKSLNF